MIFPSTNASLLLVNDLLSSCLNSSKRLTFLIFKNTILALLIEFYLVNVSKELICRLHETRLKPYDYGGDVVAQFLLVDDV